MKLSWREHGAIPMKFMSIVMIIASVIHFGLGFTFLTYINIGGAYAMITEEIKWLFMFTAGLSALSSLLQLIAAFVGAVKCESLEKIEACYVWGGITILFSVITNILQIYLQYGASIFAWSTGVIVPVFYILAAVLLKISKKKRHIK